MGRQKLKDVPIVADDLNVLNLEDRLNLMIHQKDWKILSKLVLLIWNMCDE